MGSVCDRHAHVSQALVPMIAVIHMVRTHYFGIANVTSLFFFTFRILTEFVQIIQGEKNKLY